MISKKRADELRAAGADYVADNWPFEQTGGPKSSARTSLLNILSSAAYDMSMAEDEADMIYEGMIDELKRRRLI